MRKFTPYNAFFMSDILDDTVASETKEDAWNVRRDNYVFWDFDLIPVEFSFFEIYPEESLSVDLTFPEDIYGVWDETTEDEPSFFETVFLSEIPVTSEDIFFDPVDLDWADSFRMNYSLYATFCLDIYLTTTILRAEEAPWQDALFMTFQDKAFPPLKELSLDLLFIFSLHSIFVSFFFLTRLRTFRDYVSHTFELLDRTTPLPTVSDKLKVILKVLSLC
jgi:hypothetical protein